MPVFFVFIVFHRADIQRGQTGARLGGDGDGFILGSQVPIQSYRIRLQGGLQRLRRETQRGGKSFVRGELGSSHRNGHWQENDLNNNMLKEMMAKKELTLFMHFCRFTVDSED